MTHKRPKIITAICIIGFIGLFGGVPLIFSDAAKSISSWYQPFLALSTIIGLVNMVGLWMMKKWAAVLYISMTVINQIIMIAGGIWTPMTLVIPGIISVILFLKMDLME
jgi:hypothetical protein